MGGSFRQKWSKWGAPLAAELGRTAEKLLFPPSCVGCGRAVEANGLLCPHCWGKMPFITKPYCPIMGMPFRFDPGDGFLSGEALADPPPFTAARAAVLHKGPAVPLVSGLKFSGRTELAPIMAGWMLRAGADILPQADAIIPLPLHNRRFRHRGYNQAAELGRNLARLAGKEFWPQILLRRKYTIPQVGLSAKERARNVRGVFALRPEAKALLKGRAVVLVDDVYTTGATVKAAARVLKRAGAAEVFVLTFSRAVKEEF